MKIVKSITLFFIYSLFLTFFSISSFAQLDKNACEEILGNLEIKDFKGISVITHVLTTDSLVQKPSIYIFSPLLIIFKENYISIQSENNKNQRTLYLPYNRIKFISTYNWKSIFSSGNNKGYHG